MAQSLEQILGKTINSTKELRAEINALKDSLVNMDNTSAEWETTAQKLVAAQERLSDVTNAGKASMDAAEDSIVGMEKQYKALYNTYKLLSEEQRNSDFGKQMGESLEGLSSKLNSTKKDVGNFKDNIGRYTDSAMEAFGQLGISVGALQGPMKLASMGAKGLGTALKSLIANPVGAVIMAIVLAFKALSAIATKVKEAIQGNEESQMRLNQAMSAFQPIIDAVNNAFDWLGKKVVSVIEWFGKAFNKLREIKAAVTDFLGITDGAQEAVKAEIELYSELARLQNEITLQKREQAVLNEEEQARVEELKNEAAATDDVAQKTKLLTEAQELQNKVTERKIKLAEDELRLMKEKAKLTANSAEDNQKIADKEKEVNAIRREGASKVKELTSQLTGLRKTTNTYADAIKKEKEEAKKYYEESIENEKTLTQRTREEQEKRIALMKKYGYDTKAYEEQLTKQENRDYISSNVSVNKLYDTTVNKGTGAEFATEIQTRKEALDTIGEAYKQFIIKIKTQNLDFDKEFGSFMDNLTDDLSALGLSVPAIEGLEQLKKYIEVIKKEYKDLRKEAKNADLEKLFETIDTNIATGEWNNASSINAVRQDPTLTEKEKIEKIDQLNRDWINLKIGYLEQELGLEGISADKRMELEMQIFDLKENLRQQDLEKEKAAQEALAELNTLRVERNQQIWDNSLANFANMADAIGSISSTVAALTKAEMEEGKLSEQEYKKKQKNLLALEKVQLAVAVAAIAADTAAGIMGVWRGYALEKVANAETAMAAGPAAAAVLAALNTKSLISAILNTTGIAVAGAANLAAAAGGYVSNVKAINDMGGGGADAVAATPTRIDNTAYSYTRQLQTEEEENQINQPIYVTVTDIEEGLNKAKVVEEERTF